MIKVGPQQTGTPPKSDVYVVRYRMRPSEHFAWFDGASWSVPYGNPIEAEADNRGRSELRRGMRSWLPVAYWRIYENDGHTLVDALKRAMPE